MIKTTQNMQRLLAVLFLVAGMIGQRVLADTPDFGYIKYNTAGGYYEIKDFDGIAELASYVNNSHPCNGLTFKMTADIDGGSLYTPIGSSSSHCFQGTFDGNGHTLGGESYADPLIINGSVNDYSGLFGYLSTGAVIENLTIDNVQVLVGGSGTGAIAGYNAGGTILNCCLGVNVSFSDDAPEGKKGGFVGVNASGSTISGCYNFSDYSQEAYDAVAGGNSGTISGCYYTSGKTNVAGVVKTHRLDDDKDNDYNLSEWNGTKINITFYRRTFYMDNAWNTLCLPFNLASLTGTVLSGATLKELDVTGYYDAAGNRYDKTAEGRHQTGFVSKSKTLYLYFKDATSITAGKPYIWKKSDAADILHPTFKDVTINYTLTNAYSADSSVVFTGCFSPVNLAAKDSTVLFMGSGNTLYLPDQDLSVNSCRGYFQLKAAVAAVKKVVMNLDEPVGIEHLESDDAPASTFWYDLSGRRVHLSASGSSRPTRKGLYVVNGRKVVVP